MESFHKKLEFKNLDSENQLWDAERSTSSYSDEYLYSENLKKSVECFTNASNTYYE